MYPVKNTPLGVHFFPLWHRYDIGTFVVQYRGYQSAIICGGVNKPLFQNIAMPEVIFRVSRIQRMYTGMYHRIAQAFYRAR